MSEDRTHEPPPEPPGGQDDEPPNLRLLMIVVLALLTDLERYLGEFEGDPADLRLRIDAVSNVVRREQEVLDGRAESE